jgi:hypothetical protein
MIVIFVISMSKLAKNILISYTLSKKVKIYCALLSTVRLLHLHDARIVAENSRSVNRLAKQAIMKQTKSIRTVANSDTLRKLLSG